MDSKATADSGEACCLAASTSDHRVRGKTPGNPLDGIWLVMRTRYIPQVPSTRRMLQEARGLLQPVPRRHLIPSQAKTTARKTGEPRNQCLSSLALAANTA